MILQLIDVTIMILFLLIFSGVKSNSEYMENTKPNNFTVFKGLFAILILFHHVSQQFEVTYFSIFRYIGSLIVGGFLLLSGFGLTRSYIRSGKQYFNGYFADKIVVLFVPWAICWCINDLIPKLLNGQPEYFFGISWFIVCMVFLYIGFYLSFNNNFRIIVKLFIMTISIVIYGTIVLYMIKKQINPSLFSRVGNWWIYPVPTFLLGILWALYQDKINDFMNNKRLTILLFIGLSCITNIALRSTKYPIFAGIIADFSFALLLIIIISHVNLKNRVLLKVGNYSFEFFIVHTLFMTIFLFEPIKLDTVETYLIAVIVCTVIVMIPIHYVITKYRDMLKNIIK